MLYHEQDIKIQIFLTSWPGREEMARQTEKSLPRPTTVINSGASIENWENVGDLYYGEQFKEILRKHDGKSTIMNIQGDATYHNWKEVISRYEIAHILFRPGVFAPNDTKTIWGIKPDGEDYGDGFKEVSNTDCTVWFISPKVLKILKNIDLSESKYGWGIDSTACAISRSLCLPVIRDYSITIKHNGGTGYSQEQAKKEMDKLYKKLPKYLHDLLPH